jgi:hypothetical protein
MPLFGADVCTMQVPDIAIRFCARIRATGTVLAGPVREAPGFQPEVELVNPVIAGCALLAHADAVPSVAVNVCFRKVAESFQRFVKSGGRCSRYGVVLSPRHEDGRQFGWNRRHHSEWAAIDRRGEVRTRRGVLLQQGCASDHRTCREA